MFECCDSDPALCEMHTSLRNDCVPSIRGNSKCWFPIQDDVLGCEMTTRLPSPIKAETFGDLVGPLHAVLLGLRTLSWGRDKAAWGPFRQGQVRQWEILLPVEFPKDGMLHNPMPVGVARLMP